MLKHSFHVEVLDNEANEWVDMVCTVGPNMILISYPVGFMLRDRMLKVDVVPEKIPFRSFRNWLRVSFLKPLLCNQTDIVFRDRNCMEINIGFPYDDPIVIRGEGLQDEFRKAGFVLERPVKK